MKTIGFIGLGLMGEPMSRNLVTKFAGTVLVYDMNPQAIARVVAAGAEAAASIEDIARRADVIFTMVPKSVDVQAVYEAMLPHLRAGQITVDMSTIDPSVSQALAETVKGKGAAMLDAPVVKSVPAAEAGELGIYVGGDESAYQTVRPLLAMMGSNQIHLGANGRGLVMKMLHNTLVAGIQNSVNEMLNAAEVYGIGKAEFTTAVSYGGAMNFYLTSKVKSLIEENYKPVFSLQNMAKDVNIMCTMMQEKGLHLPGVALVKQVYDKGVAAGFGTEDFCATYKVVHAGLHGNRK
ncbi:NAD(P)-dependent oxidoreductase [Azospirillum thermophilum]|uniref:3-hydroxyisobutyrate dehydrogenase n=1 Tax=Azospirillum thermophilum TaxID=2202148 RepID=A0A2S2CKU7_9PROT|nr:NAD(P)-dependent oxidoreductase [Azospirillum thermophilum]AWK84937.1 3-hydroxyisobutyrate dehydrogenase [Azospirillum thermophilum]